ncbi:MAG: DNRLRE domain-containing protein, partial [Thermomicrobiales bacterium]
MALGLAGNVVSAQVRNSQQSSVSVALQIHPTADALVNSTKPTTNYGTAKNLAATTFPGQKSYLTFDLTAIEAVDRATLRVFSISRNWGGMQLRSVPNAAWDESTITWRTAPETNDRVVSVPQRSVQNGWLEIDVTSLVAGGGITSMALVPVSGSQMSLASRESNYQPVLLIEPAAAQPEPPSPTPTATSTPVAPTPTVTSTATSTPVQPSPTATATAAPPTPTATQTPVTPTATVTATPSPAPVPPTPTATPTVPVTPSGPTFYLSPSGNDSNPGSQAAPWRTFTFALKQIEAGDTLLVRGGTYVENAILNGSSTLAKGTSSSRITVRAYPGENPVLSGIVHLSNADYWTIDNIDVQWNPANTDSTQHMFRFYKGTGWELKNSELWGAQSFAALLVNGGSTDFWIHHNYIHDTQPSNGISQDHSIYVGDGKHGVIEFNLLVNAPNGRGVKLGHSQDGF